MPTRQRMPFAALGVGSLSMLTFCAAARGQIIVEHTPTQGGGPGADTDFIYFGQEIWSLVADDIRLSVPALARRIQWWAFYDRDNPPLNETIRIRWYDARPGDGLPGGVLYEQSVLNPSRTWTGRIIYDSVLPREYLFSADLATPFALAAETTYWLEIVQLNDISTAYRWEAAVGDLSGFAYQNAITVDWWHTTSNPDLALRLLSVPEPATVFPFIAMAAAQVSRRRGRKEGRIDSHTPG